MTVECTPEIARDVAGRLTNGFNSFDRAATSLLSTSTTNATTDLTTGIGLITSECVQEIGLVTSILSDLAASVEGADSFSGAAEFYEGNAEKTLAQLIRSLSDGRGDLGGGTPERRLDLLTDEIWPNGVPAGLSDEELVAAIMNDPRSATMTPEELAAIWPELPASGREAYAGDEPVAVLDLVVDGKLILAEEELDAAARSVYSSPPTVDIEVDPELAEALDDAAAGRWGIPPFADRTGAAIERADILIDAGEAGREFRDATNHPVTYLALVLGLQAGGSAERTDDGLIVVVVPDDATVSVDDLLGSDLGGAFGVEVPPFGKGGTTYGNTFIVPADDVTDRPDADLLHHENIHTYQWAGAGPAEYGALYIAESLKSGVQDLVENADVDVDVDVDVDTVNVDLGPLGPSQIPSVEVPGSSWLPDWVPTPRTPAIDLPQFDPPSIPVPVGVDVDLDVDVDLPFNTGCNNRFEQHADLEDGNYHSCEP